MTTKVSGKSLLFLCFLLLLLCFIVVPVFNSNSKIMIKHRAPLHLIWVYTVCKCPVEGRYA